MTGAPVSGEAMGYADHIARRMAERAEVKADSIGARQDRTDDDIREGFREVGLSISRVHRRIDRLLWGILAALAVLVSQIVLRKVGLL